MPSLIVRSISQDDLDLLRSKWGWLLAAGILMTVIGLLALGNLFLATVASVFFVGTMMLIGGFAQIAFAFQVKAWGHFFAWLLIGVLYAAAGFVAFVNPLLASAFLTFLLAVSLLVAGIFRVVAGIALRPAGGWGWMVAAGVVTVIVAGIVLAGWPVNSLWLIGALLGVDLVFNGVALAVSAFALRQIRPSSGSRVASSAEI